jgi:hypothetical protein
MNTNHPDKCPYSIGQMVVYRPSQRGIDEDVMSPPSGKLTPGKTYRIAAIQDELYVLPEGYKHPGGGVYWTEFAAE